MRIGIAAALLAGCGGDSGAVPGANGGASFAPAMPAVACQRASGANGTPINLSNIHGWMSPDEKTKTSLLYVSDEGAGAVDIFSVPDYKLEGQISSGIDQPEASPPIKTGSCTSPTFAPTR